MSSMSSTHERARALGTDIEQGLSDAQVAASRAANGENRLPEPESDSIWELFVESLKDKTLLILMGAAVLAIGVEVLQGQMNPNHTPHYLDGIAILCAVAIASLVATINQVRAQKEFTSLRRERDDVAVKVRRNGQVREISFYELVVGDLVFLSTGDRVPADGALLNAVDLSVDESMLTGESVPAEKGPDDADMKSGANITAGSGTMLVTAVGRGTELGKLQTALTEVEEDPTPLQERLSALADRIGVFGLGAAVATFLALAASGFFRGTLSLSFDIATVSELLSFAIVAVTIVVVAVPEGLPLAVTISLAYSIRKMAKDKALVRKLESCETMGAATVIASDKTGTLTKNQMTVARTWVNGKFNDVPKDATTFESIDRELMQQIACINSTAFLERTQGQVRYLGNPTECALLMMMEGWGVDWQNVRSKADVLHQFSFSSDRKRMSSLIRLPNGGLRLLIKGAPEVVLGLSGQLHGGGKLDDGERKRVLDQVQKFSSEGQRTLGFAYRDLPADAHGVSEHGEAAAKLLEQQLVFLGLVAISDPVRPEVVDAVRAAKQAGVDVKMVTGDNKIVAEAIARELSLMQPGDISMEGAEFRAKSDAELVPLLPKLRILARTVPSDKHRLVKLLKAHGEVVAVTGDGTNDATALRDADVGFAMGSGTEVAKEASDIVIVDDNFASIVRAIQWGRSIFENIRKFLQFQLTVNVVALTTAFSAAVLGFGIPLNTVQLLWVNLLMDSLAALALAAEPPRPVLLQQAPHGRHAPLISKSMWTSILVTGGIMVAVLLGSMFFAQQIIGVDDTTPEGEIIRNTFIFNTFVMMQLFNEINARATRFSRSVLDGFFQSSLFISVLASTFVTQVLIIQFGGAFFKTVPLSLDLWIRSIAMGASVLVIGFVLRLVGRLLFPSWEREERLAKA